ncbi:type II toxin-antitoxin system Phd/YefM family antitoxin [Rhodobacter sp. NSM]|uniref:type II toxin-antitoxin system Phd/YefM family antitoxin n=1 Tax=Rhodobacter sp. NSM TaxID=3457501 RepID=UPI003FD5D1B4
MRVTSTEFQQNVGTYSDAAQREPVIITSHNRDRLVLLSAEEYRSLTGQTEGVSEERKRLIRERAEYHRNTIIELANR